MSIRVPVLMAVLAVFGSMASAADSRAADSASGSFRYGDVELHVAHAYLFRVDSGAVGGELESMVFLTSRPIGAASAAAAFDVESAVSEQFYDGDGGFVRICLDGLGGECGLYFSAGSESFNTSGYGEFVLEKDEPGSVAGSWVLAEPEDFFDKTYEFELRFAAERVAPPESTPLPEGGGEPGEAYLAYIEAIAKGDLPALRVMMGEEASWQLPEDDPEACKQQLKWMRDGSPVQATILRGELRADHAILVISGADRDDIALHGRVRMVKTEQGWRYDTDDLETE